MRPYQDWLRSEIRSRREAIVAEQDEIERAFAAVRSDTSLSTGQSLDMQLELGNRRSALDDEDVGFRVELGIRDSPEQTAEFGPGRD